GRRSTDCRTATSPGIRSRSLGPGPTRPDSAGSRSRSRRSARAGFGDKVAVDPACRFAWCLVRRSDERPPRAASPDKGAEMRFMMIMKGDPPTDASWDREFVGQLVNAMRSYDADLRKAGIL